MRCGIDGGYDIIGKHTREGRIVGNAGDTGPLLSHVSSDVFVFGEQEMEESQSALKMLLT